MTGEEARELKHSLMWQALVGEIEDMIKGETNMMIQCPVENIPIIRERIISLRNLINLPQNIIDREE
jgi:hypothetical protein